jgi:hypothetical protein
MTIATTTPTPAQIKTAKYSNKVFPLSKEAYEQLKASIARHKGLYVPIAINKTGDVLDGHHRLRACTELGIAPTFEIPGFKSDLEEELFVYEINRARRQLTPFQNIEIALKEKPLLSELARINMKAGKTLSRQRERVHVDKALARQAGVSKDTLYRVDKVLKAAQKNPDRKLKVDYQNRLGNSAYPTYTKVVEDARQGKLSIAQAYAIINRDERIEQKYEEIATAAKALHLPERIMLLNADSTKDIPEIKDGFVDLIITDPPYPREYMGLFDDLARFALRKLKPGGSLVTFYNRVYAPETYAIFHKYKEQGLNYWWTIAVQHGGGIGTRVHTRGVIPMWKEMLWYVKGDKKAGVKDIRDFVQSSRKVESKMIHQWAQSRVEAEYIIEDFTLSKDALVVDPFLGSGEFAIACAKLGRYFIGVEKDKQIFERAKEYITLECR